LVESATDGRAKLQAATKQVSDTPGGNGGSSAEAETAASVAKGPVIDIDAAMKRLNHDMNLFREFIGYFDEDSPKLLATLRRAVAIGDPSKILNAAHSLKGLAANFGAERCVAIAGDLERLGKTNELAQAEDLVARLEQEVARLDAALSEYRV
jgi:HPt (histidine-containing phosphotransfer) domain-containing protein